MQWSRPETGSLFIYRATLIYSRWKDENNLLCRWYSFYLYCAGIVTTIAQDKEWIVTNSHVSGRHILLLHINSRSQQQALSSREDTHSCMCVVVGVKCTCVTYMLEGVMSDGCLYVGNVNRTIFHSHSLLTIPPGLSLYQGHPMTLLHLFLIPSLLCFASYYGLLSYCTLVLLTDTFVYQLIVCLLSDAGQALCWELSFALNSSTLHLEIQLRRKMRLNHAITVQAVKPKQRVKRPRKQGCKQDPFSFNPPVNLLITFTVSWLTSKSMKHLKIITTAITDVPVFFDNLNRKRSEGTDGMEPSWSKTLPKSKRWLWPYVVPSVFG